MDLVDLHVHTDASDGRYSPDRVLELAGALGLRAVAFADHDTMAGFLAAPADRTVELVPAVEVKADFLGREVHVLGYFLDPARLDFLARDREARDWRNREMVARMQADGVSISMAALQARRPGRIIGRPHMAALLVEQGLFPDTAAAFSAWLGEGGRYYVPRPRQTLAQAAMDIRAAGGKAVLAHPLQYALSPDLLRRLARECRECGFSGLEAIYSGYSPDQTAMLTALAGSLGLCVTGGSDYHGPQRPGFPLGGVPVPYALLARLREAAV